MKKFEVGKSYTHGWIGDAELFTTWLVFKRTAQTITIKTANEVRTCKINKQISEWENAESVYPLGRYSMCPILTAK